MKGRLRSAPPAALTEEVAQKLVAHLRARQGTIGDLHLTGHGVLRIVAELPFTDWEWGVERLTVSCETRRLGDQSRREVPPSGA